MNGPIPMKPPAESSPEIPLAATIPMLKKHGAVLTSIGCRRIEIRYTPTRCPYLVGFVDHEDVSDAADEDNDMGDLIDNA